jgi:hypothetical protein
MYVRRLITDDEFIAYDRLFEFNRIALYYCRQADFERSAAELFEIEQISYEADYLTYTYHPIYSLRRKTVKSENPPAYL